MNFPKCCFLLGGSLAFNVKYYDYGPTTGTSTFAKSTICRPSIFVDLGLHPHANSRQGRRELNVSTLASLDNALTG